MTLTHELKLKTTMTSLQNLKKLLFIIVSLVLTSESLNAQSVGGTLTSTDTSKCATANNGLITLSGHTGSVIRWEYSYSGGDPWTPIPVTATTYNFSNLSQSISYRAIVQQPSFLPATSSVIRVNVYSATVAGTLSGPSTVCNNVVNEFLLNGKNGRVIDWEVSTTSGSSWSVIPASNDSISKHLSMNVNSWFRANVDNGACLTQTTPVLQVITFSPTISGTISGTDSICGNVNSVALTLSGQTANQYLWEYGNTANGPWQSTAITGTTYNFSNQVSTLFYRVKQQNGACSELISPAFQVNHSVSSVGGTVSGSNYVCLNDTFSLTAVNYTGSILNWNYRLQGNPTWIVINSTSSILDFAIPTPGNYEFSVTVKNGFCNSTMSQIKVLGVKDLPNVAFTVPNTCEDVSVSFSNTTPGTNVFSWSFGNGSSSSLQSPSIVYDNGGTYTVKLTATSSFGCTDSISQPISVFIKPMVSFLTADSICAQGTVVFTNLSNAGQGSVTSYSWLDNNTAFSSIQNPSLAVAQSGNRVIRLTVTNSFGCTHFMDSTIIVNPKPYAAFTVNSACLGESLTFQNQSNVTSGALAYAWNFGDSQTSNLLNPNHTYTAAGTYNTSLTVSTNYGCTDTVIEPVQINPSPTVDFSANPVCRVDSMIFIPAISGVTTYTTNWNFGDGYQSTLESPHHLYSSFGTFSVAFEVVSDFNCTAQIVKPVQVYPMPTANFSITNGCEGTTIGVDNNSAIANGSFISDWSFNNEALIQEFEPSHLFPTSGIYPVFLQVTSDLGCIDTLTNYISIYQSPVSGFTFSNTCNGTPVQFANTSTTASGTITQNMWDFGDNSNSTLENPTKDYLNFGSYTVQLIVVSSVGCSDTLEQIVQSYEQPIANFGVGNVCFGEETVFDNQTILSSGSFTSAWEFGDSGTSVIVSPTYEYLSPGNYIVQLAIMSDQGCPDTISKPVVVYYLPVVNAGSDTTTDKGIPVELNVTGAAEYTWTPSAGLDNPNVSDPFANPDSTTTYIVYGESIYGCVNSDTMVVTVVETYKVIPYNLLTPDANGKNDTWIIEYISSYPDNEVVVVNEIGSEVFRQKAYNDTWDGKNKTGEILPDGTYYYHLIFENSDIEYKGEILLLRNL